MNKTYFCGSCDLSYTRNQTLKNHIQRKHGHSPQVAPVEQPDKGVGEEWTIKLPEGFTVGFTRATGLGASSVGFFEYLCRLIDNDELFEELRYDSEWARSVVNQVLLRRKVLAA